MSRYNHIFFDLDNTLWDFGANSKETLELLFQQYLSKRILEVQFDDFFEKYRLINNGYWAKYRHRKINKEALRVNRFKDVMAIFGVSDDSLAIHIAKEYIEICPYKTQMMPGCFKVLDYLKEKNYPMAIITNGFDEVQQIKMENCGLNEYFQVMVSSEQTGNKKPYPEIFKHAFSLVDANPATSIMIGDNHDSDIIGASNVGMDSVYLKLKDLPDRFQGNFIIQELEELMKIL